MKAIIEFFLYGSLKKILFGSGLSLVSGGLALTVIFYYVDKLIAYLDSLTGSLNGYLVPLMGVVGIDIYLSLVIGAYIVKYTIKATRLFLTKAFE